MFLDRSGQRSCALLVAMGLLFLVAPKASATGTLPLAIPGNVSVTEGSGPFQMTFVVTNNTNSTLLLDYAFASISPLGPDPDDLASFAGANGSNGLASANLYMLAGGTATFTYNVDTLNPPEGNDFGLNRFDFTAEFQIYTGSIASLPNPNHISSGSGAVWFLGDNSSGYVEDPNALNMLGGFGPLPFGTTLFHGPPPENSTAGIFVVSTISAVGDPNPFVDHSPRIRVRDIDEGAAAVPEPTSLVMSGTAALCLFGFLRFRRLRPVAGV